MQLVYFATYGRQEITLVFKKILPNDPTGVIYSLCRLLDDWKEKISRALELLSDHLHNVVAWRVKFMDVDMAEPFVRRGSATVDS